MNILTIVGLSLLAPLVFVLVFIIINDIIITFEDSPSDFIAILIVLMALVGAILLYISVA